MLISPPLPLSVLSLVCRECAPLPLHPFSSLTPPCLLLVLQLTLVFSHMLADLKAVYKDGVRDEAFVIVKLEARKFWADHFGTRFVLRPLPFFRPVACTLGPLVSCSVAHPAWFLACVAVNDRVVVPWEEAFAVLKSVHKLTDLEQPALQHTMV